MMQEDESSDDGQIKNIKQDELKEIILEHQNRVEKGYYTF